MTRNGASAGTRAREIEAEIGEIGLKAIDEQIRSQVEKVTTVGETASAWIDYYLLINFGFTPHVPYEPNSVQFYGPSGFLCHKLIDNASMQSLAPILACRYVCVTWDVSTQESVHIYGYEPKS